MFSSSRSEDTADESSSSNNNNNPNNNPNTPTSDGSRNHHPPQQPQEEEEPWTISIKTVGKGVAAHHNHNHNSTAVPPPSELPREFTVRTSPTATLSQFKTQIRTRTGLEHIQQRLIYRGRLLHDDADHHHATSDDDEMQMQTQSLGMRMKDVEGLEDGHTIHLVPRTNIHNDATATATATSTAIHRNSLHSNDRDDDNDHAHEEDDDHNHDSDDDDDERGSGGGGGGFPGILSALLSMAPGLHEDADHGSDNPNANNNTNNTNTSHNPRTTTTTTANTNANTTTARTRRRQNAARRTADDPRYPHPSPLEPVRQGLMTMHTMMGSHNPYHPSIMVDQHHHHQQHEEEDSQIIMPSRPSSRSYAHAHAHARARAHDSPLSATRWWYKGQWLDVRDTVNQWLEATVVEVLSPDDILIRCPPTTTTAAASSASSSSSSSSSPAASTSMSTTPIPAMDAAIGANDHPGRLRLLLEPHPTDPSTTTLSRLNANDPALIGMQERSTNDTVQLLLVHYNGWPHRWDEWIRSDSERIRPFRTRSRHVLTGGSSSSSSSSLTSRGVCPLPESHFVSAPDTFVKSGDDEGLERGAVVQEVYRVLNHVNDLFARGIGVEEEKEKEKKEEDRHPIRKALRQLREEEEKDGGLWQSERNGHPSSSSSSSSYHSKRPLTSHEREILMTKLRDVPEERLEHVLSIVEGENEGGKTMDPSDIDVDALDEETRWRLYCYLVRGVHRAGSGSGSGSGGEEDGPSALDLVHDRQLPWEIRRDPCSRGRGNEGDAFDEAMHGGDGNGNGNGTDEREDKDNEMEEVVPNRNASGPGPGAGTSDFDKKTLEALAPLLDRLGRILIDAAPHVATIADSLPDPEPEPEPELALVPEHAEEIVEADERAEHETVNGTSSEDRRQEGEGEETAPNTTPDNEQESGSSQQRQQPRSLRPAWAETIVPSSLFESRSGESNNSNNNNNPSTNPDYVDFVHGFINYRENGSSLHQRSSRSNRTDSGSSLLSGFLASALRSDAENRNGRNGPRVVRLGGGGNGNGGGNGIDIHIHAVVTGGNGTDVPPDLNEFADMVAGAGMFERSRLGTRNSGTTTNNNNNNNNAGFGTMMNSARAPPPPVPEVDEEDMGLFDDLYAESPMVEQDDAGDADAWRHWTTHSDEEDEIVDDLHDDDDDDRHDDNDEEEEDDDDDENQSGSSLPGLLSRDNGAYDSSSVSSSSSSDGSVPGLMPRFDSGSSSSEDGGTEDSSLDDDCSMNESFGGRNSISPQPMDGDDSSDSYSINGSNDENACNNHANPAGPIVRDVNSESSNVDQAAPGLQRCDPRSSDDNESSSDDDDDQDQGNHQPVSHLFDHLNLQHVLQSSRQDQVVADAIQPVNNPILSPQQRSLLAGDANGSLNRMTLTAADRMMRVDNGMPLPMQQGPPSHDHPNFRGPRAPDYDEGVEDGVPNVEYHSHRFASHTGSSDVDENEEETDDDDSTKNPNLNGSSSRPPTPPDSLPLETHLLHSSPSREEISSHSNMNVDIDTTLYSSRNDLDNVRVYTDAVETNQDDEDDNSDGADELESLDALDSVHALRSSNAPGEQVMHNTVLEGDSDSAVSSVLTNNAASNVETSENREAVDGADGGDDLSTNTRDTSSSRPSFMRRIFRRSLGRNIDRQ